MANIKSAKKRTLTIAKKTSNNKNKRSRIKTYIKKFELALENNNLEEARVCLKSVEKYLDQAACTNLVSKNAASRKVSRLTKKLNTAV